MDEGRSVESSKVRPIIRTVVAVLLFLFYMFPFFIQGETGLPESIVSALRIPAFFDRLLTLICMIILIEQKVKKKLALIFSEC